MQINLKNVSKSFGSENLFEIASLTINENDKVGIVGRNGSGKTTLLNIISGRDSNYSGNIYGMEPENTGFLMQDLSLEDDNDIYTEVFLGAEKYTEREERLGELLREIEEEKNEEELILLNREYEKLHLEFERMGGYTYRSLTVGIIKGLGFGEEDFFTPVGTLSGGQKMRVALAKLLASNPDMLILDEPTNYLDTESIQWLERYLGTLDSTVIAVSHDRYFLDVFTNRIIELDRKQAFEYKGNYSEYIKKKKINDDNYQKAYLKQQEEIARQQKVIQKLKQFNREKTVKRARSREKLLEKIDELEKPESMKKTKFSFPYIPMISKKAITLEGVDFGYGMDDYLINDLNLTVTDNDRLGICGQNATGKTTLLKLMCGVLEPKSGLVRQNPRTRILYFSQEHRELDNSLSIIDYFRRETGKDDLEIRNLLARLLFTGDDINKMISSLSGGEKSRVAFAMLMIKPSNILILDEPTNHLDIDTKEMLEDALLEYEGAVVSVSHDRYFLNKLAKRILYFTGEDTRLFLGNYDEAMNRVMSENQQDTEEKENRKTRKRNSQGLSNNKVNSYLSRLNEIEEEISSLELERKTISLKMENMEFASDPDFLHEGSVRMGEIEENIEELETEWMEIQSILEENETQTQS